jgi:hypothetical protein
VLGHFSWAPKSKTLAGIVPLPVPGCAQEGRSQWSGVCEALTAATVPSAPPPPAMLGSNQSSISITWKASQRALAGFCHLCPATLCAAAQFSLLQQCNPHCEVLYGVLDGLLVLACQALWLRSGVPASSCRQALELAKVLWVASHIH